MGRYLLCCWGILAGMLWGHWGLGLGSPASLSCQISIISAQDPPYFPGPFSINGQGWLLAPSQGLRGQAQKVSMTWDVGIHNGQSHTTSWRFVLGLLDFAASFRHSPNLYMLPHSGCSSTLAWFCAGFWSSRKRRDSWLWEHPVPLIELRILKAVTPEEKVLGKVASTVWRRLEKFLVYYYFLKH